MTPYSVSFQRVSTSSPSSVFGAFWPSISDGRRELNQPSCRGSAERVSSDQPLVRQALVGDPVHEAVQALHSVPPNVPFVQPERELIDVAVKVFRRDVVVDYVLDGVDAGTLTFVKRKTGVNYIITKKKTGE